MGQSFGYGWRPRHKRFFLQNYKIGDKLVPNIRLEVLHIRDRNHLGYLKFSCDMDWAIGSRCSEFNNYIQMGAERIKVTLVDIEVELKLMYIVCAFVRGTVG